MKKYAISSTPRGKSRFLLAILSAYICCRVDCINSFAAAKVIFQDTWFSPHQDLAIPFGLGPSAIFQALILIFAFTNTNTKYKNTNTNNHYGVHLLVQLVHAHVFVYFSSHCL